MRKNIIYSIMFIMMFSILNFMCKYNFNIDTNKKLDENIIIETPIIARGIIVEPKVEVIEVVEIEPELEVVFNENDLNEVSNITYEKMNQLLSSTTMSHLANAIVDAEKIHGVNAFLTLGIIALESSWATSTRTVDSNNLTGMAVYGDESPGEYYNTQYECVLETARQIKKHYLSLDGMYYNGSSTKAVNVKYSANKNWYNIVNEIAYEMINNYDKLTEGE